MKGLLVRAGIDQAYGHWNAPIDPRTNQFIYVPIPEKQGTKFHSGLSRPYKEFHQPLEDFCAAFHLNLPNDLHFPSDLQTYHMHLDPDFEHLTYGDQGTRRGARMRDLLAGDIIAFYAGFRPIYKCSQKLIYAIFGLYTVEDVVKITDVPKKLWFKNAHTRKINQGATDIIVRAIPEESGRLQRCIPIGQWRDGAYRVRKDLLRAWG